MRKLLLFTVFALFCVNQMVAQEYEYVSFVREGVKWVCYFGENYNPMYDDPNKLDYFNLEFKGDTIINGKTYKLMHKYHGDSINTVNDTVAVCMREEDKVVYAFVPDGKYYCPIGNYFKESDFKAIQEGREFVLYDFKNPISYWSNFADSLQMNNFDFIGADLITLGNHHVKAYSLFVGYLCGVNVIEGIGLDATNSYPLAFFLPSWPGAVEQTVVGLKHVIENGEIIYNRHDYDGEHPDWYEHEYVPFVREGVKWIYYYNNPFQRDILNMDEGIQYYSFEMKGDVQIGDKHYKQVCLTHYLDENNKEVEEFIPVYLREEDKVVYAIQPDGMNHPQCPVGVGLCVDDLFEGTSVYNTDEFILYDFNNPISLYDRLSNNAGCVPFFEYLETDYITAGSHISKRHYYRTDYTNNDVIIEGIGYDGDAGMPLFFFKLFSTGTQVDYALSHVVENGEIIYKGIHFNPDNQVGVGEVVADQWGLQDGYYYDLMGRAVGKDVPTMPGIYIHNGKKIVVR